MRGSVMCSVGSASSPALRLRWHRYGASVSIDRCPPTAPSSSLSVRAAQFLQPLSLFDYDVADVRQFHARTTVDRVARPNGDCDGQRCRPSRANPGGMTCATLSKALERIESLPTGVASTGR